MGPPHGDHQREFAEQGAGARDDFAPPPSSTRNAPRCTMKSGIGVVTLVEEDFAAREIALFGADRKHAQRRCPQQAKGGDALE